MNIYLKVMKYSIISLLLAICSCGISHREGGIIVTDVNGFFSGSLQSTSRDTNVEKTIPVEAAIVQTDTEIYGTLSGIFSSHHEEIRITGFVEGATLTIIIEEGIGPLTLSGTVSERSFTLEGTKYENDKSVQIQLYLETKRIAPLQQKVYY